MDPPRSSQAWKLIFMVWLLNLLATPLVFLIGFNLLGGRPQDIDAYRIFMSGFFVPWSQVGFFIINLAVKPALIEEFFFRFPAILIWIAGRRLKSRALILFAILTALGLNTFWAYGHITIPTGYRPDGSLIFGEYYFILPPVFFSGLTWIWLNFKIQSRWPWPSIIAHILANTSLYLFVKIALFFEINIF